MSRSGEQSLHKSKILSQRNLTFINKRRLIITRSKENLNFRALFDINKSTWRLCSRDNYSNGIDLHKLLFRKVLRAYEDKFDKTFSLMRILIASSVSLIYISLISVII
jgi:hypothetical protein